MPGELVVVCGGREVDDQLRPVGAPCQSRYRPRWVPLTVAGLVERARAGGWAVPDGHGDGPELVGTCPRCRRPPPEVRELVREVRRRG